MRGSTVCSSRWIEQLCRPRTTNASAIRHNSFSVLPIAADRCVLQVRSMNDIVVDQQTALLRVLIADNSPRSAGSLNGLIEEYGDFEIVGHARTAIDTVTLIERLRPDVVLLDMEMPGDTFAFLLKLIKRDLSHCKVVVMIPYASCVLRERSREAGADHVFEKTGDSDRLLSFLMRLAQAKRFTFRAYEQEG